MNAITKGAAKRLILSLGAAAALSGCATYGPAYPAYAAAPAAASYYASPYPYSYPYYGAYGDGHGYAGPPISLGFGYDGNRHYGGHGWHGRGWSAGRGADHGHPGAGRIHGGAPGGFHGGGRGGFHGRSHR